jgi:hypothetical protein
MVMTSSQFNLGARLAAAGALAAALFVSSAANAHEDPAGCFQTGPAIVISVFRANGTTGVTGSVSQCETINYQARLQKAQDSDTICAFSQGTFSLTTPDGVIHSISANVPCIGGTSGEGCDSTVDFLDSVQFPYQIRTQDISGGFVTATAQYTGGVAHDNPDNTAGVAANTPKSTPVIICTDNNLCTSDVCDPNATGAAACSFPAIPCNDNNACTTEACNPATGICANTGTTICNDNNACTTEACNPATGQCQNTGTTTCNDNNACTTEACNTSTGQCQNTGTTTCNDNNACTTESCNTSTGQCQTDTTKTCNDNNACTTESCNTSTGQCQTDSTTTCTDNNACTSEACNTSTGQCETTNEVQCDDNNVCTDDSCNPQTGQCVFTPNDNPECVEAICRTPGFWKTHGSTSQSVLTANGGCVEICGEVITTATANSVGSANSVLEAMCISPRGEQRLQLVRQLTALALNCGVSGFGLDCGSNAGLDSLFSSCNAACLSNSSDVGDCIEAIDCFNNGGAIDPTSGLCGAAAFNCHEAPLGIPQGSADTPQACNAASKNSCTVILGGEANCTSGVKQAAPESCP